MVFDDAPACAWQDFAPEERGPHARLRFSAPAKPQANSNPPRTRLAPDLAIFLGDRSKELENAKVIQIVPEIVVEVLSPSERPGRIHRKLNLYFDGGVKEVWMVDPEGRIVEIWTGTRLPDHAFSITDSLSSTLLPRFQLSLEELFS